MWIYVCEVPVEAFNNEASKYGFAPNDLQEEGNSVLLIATLK